MIRVDFYEQDPGRSQNLPAEPAFLVDIDGFEGPLDLLLELARRQKVDLHKISILALAEQYFGFIELARTIRLELAADYLVMAAWLAYLKSRLLLPSLREATNLRRPIWQPPLPGVSSGLSRSAMPPPC